MTCVFGVCLQTWLVANSSSADRAESKSSVADRDRMEQQLADSLESLQRLLQKKMQLCKQQQQLQSSAVKRSSDTCDSSKGSQLPCGEAPLEVALQAALQALTA